MVFRTPAIIFGWQSIIPMKMQLLLALTALAFLTACKKTDEPVRLDGEWQLTAVYNAYRSGGSFAWEPVVPARIKTIRFLPDGRFTESEPANASSCPGRYEVAGSQLLLDSDCGEAFALRIDRFDTEVMELAIPVREGEVIERYTRR